MTYAIECAMCAASIDAFRRWVPGADVGMISLDAGLAWNAIFGLASIEILAFDFATHTSNHIALFFGDTDNKPCAL